MTRLPWPLSKAYIFYFFFVCNISDTKYDKINMSYKEQRNFPTPYRYNLILSIMYFLEYV